MRTAVHREDMATDKPHKGVSPSPSASTDDKNPKNSTGNESQDWQNEMLKRLIKSAIPEPIKVACTVTPPGKPEYLGEEYHGTITRDKEKRILDGRNGRFIVRDSFTKSGPNEYTLAFNYDSSIQHIKLIYNENSKEFSTDAKKKGFKTVLELISDVLKLFAEFQRRESQVLFKKGNYNKAHVFKKYSYKHPKWCDVCGNFLWGLVNQGEKCEVCGINTHKSCKEAAPLPCSTVVVGRKVSVPKEEEKGSLKASKSDSSNYIYISPKCSIFDECAYFRKCSRFLSAFNIRDSYIDLQNNMTRCFCTECIEKTSSNFNAGTVSSENLKQWTRFQFEPQTDPLKREIGTWEVVYFAVNPKFVRNLIKRFFDPSTDEEEEEIVVAPSLAYTTQDMQNDNWSYKFSNTETGGELFAQTVLEVYLRPESFEIMPVSEQGATSEDNNDPVILPEHWKAKSKKDLYPKSILVKIFEK